MNSISMFLGFLSITMLFQLLHAQSTASKDLFRCRQNCYQKFVQDWHHCMDFEDCKNMCITPPNINSYIPEAFSFLCWNDCDQQLGPFPLNINSALRQGSLVLTDIGWDQAITNASKQCLVTWEVSGGGLMGNLLTDSSTVELSLWPDTVYHVQVTCKHKETGGMRRSYKLIVDTHKLGDSTATGLQAITLENNNRLHKPTSSMYGNEVAATAGLENNEPDSRMRILKDSSKDFLTPYYPDAASAKVKSSSSSSSSNSDRNTKINSNKVVLSSAGNDADNEVETAPHLNTVTRTKLINGIAMHNVSENMPILTQSIVFAMVGSAIIFFGLLALYVLTRPAPKELPLSTIHCNDKQVLIHNELLPEKVQSAPGVGVGMGARATQFTDNNTRATTSAAAAAAAATASISGTTRFSTHDSGTLHV